MFALILSSFPYEENCAYKYRGHINIIFNILCRMSYLAPVCPHAPSRIISFTVWVSFMAGQLANMIHFPPADMIKYLFNQRLNQNAKCKMSAFSNAMLLT